MSAVLRAPLSAPLAAPLDALILPAGAGLRFVDACSLLPIVDGLRCRLLRRRDGRLIGVAATTPSGVHHWPDLAAPWRQSSSAVPASPPAASLADVLVEDLLERFLPLRLPWPATPAAGESALTRITLCSAPQRAAPAGCATIHALLADADGTPAAWARVIVSDSQARSTVGMSDAGGRLTLHLPFPRPERWLAGSPPPSPPLSPPAPAAISASVSLRVFHAAALGIDALASGAPCLPEWQSQPEVRALARVGASESFGPLRLFPDRPCVPVSEGLAAHRSELRLTPL